MFKRHKSVPLAEVKSPNNYHGFLKTDFAIQIIVDYFLQAGIF